MECSKCGISERQKKLFDAISSKGIAKVCESCAYEANLALIKKPTEVQLKQAEKRKTVYERLSSAAGIDPAKLDFSNPVKSSINKVEDVSLKDLVDKNFNKGLAKNSEPREDLVKNFHWTIMRARRSKKLTQEQLAKELHEPETAIKMVEKGVLPTNEAVFISKLESFLGIRISNKVIKRPALLLEPVEITEPSVEFQMKKESSFEPVDPFGDEDKELEKIAERAERAKQVPEIEEDPEEMIDFAPVSTKSLSIADLKAMKKDKEESVFKENPVNKTDLSEDEINNILFGKKSD